ncbi:hypothetical protein MNBD_NITROSPINAE04-853 [hydrothermal vent metagenome]|uniref:Mu-like prophage I protein n=1 Tax=hydrothermal vent metagenome TaxID=652676 RepID=A0A3B1BR44_9ZZZZ
MTIKLDKPVVIVPFGRFPHPGGMQIIDRGAVERIMDQFSKWERDIVVDYQHESLKECGRAPAAGWVKAKTAVVTQNGIEAVIEWTGEAREMIESKNYLYLSPVFEKEEGVIARLFNLGLTNNPNIQAMEPLVNQSTNQEILMENKSEESNPAESLAPTEQDAPTLALLLGDVVALLGLTPEAVDEEIIAKIKELAKETASKRQGEIETLVNDAVSAGKLRPSLSDWAVNLARVNPGSFETFLVNSGPSAPLGGVMTGGANARPRLSMSESSVCRMLGLDEKEYLTFGDTQTKDN